MQPLTATSNLHVHARNLGVIFNSALNFNKQINSVTKGCNFQLWNFSKLKSTLSLNSIKAVGTTLISTRLVYLVLFVVPEADAECCCEFYLVAQKETALHQHWHPCTGYLTNIALISRLFYFLKPNMATAPSLGLLHPQKDCFKMFHDEG